MDVEGKPVETVTAISPVLRNCIARRSVDVYAFLFRSVRSGSKRKFHQDNHLHSNSLDENRSYAPIFLAPDRDFCWILFMLCRHSSSLHARLLPALVRGFLIATVLCIVPHSGVAGEFYKVKKALAASDISSQANQSVPMVVTGLSPAGRMTGFYTVDVHMGSTIHLFPHAFVWDDATQTVTDLSGGLAASWSMAICINNSGTVAGLLWTNGIGRQKGFTWHDGTVHAFLAPEGTDVDLIVAVNNLGHVIGTYYSDDHGNKRAFFWDGTTATDLGDLGNTDDPFVWPQAINDLDQIVGTNYDIPLHGAAQPTAFQWKNGEMSPLDGADQFSFTMGQAINNAGEITGAYYNPQVPNTLGAPGGFYWSTASIIDLGDLGGGGTSPFSIDTNGTIFGTTYNLNNVLRLFRWETTPAAMTDLGAANLATADQSYQISSSNALGEIAGFTVDSNNNLQATIRTAGQQYRLTDLLPAYLSFTQINGEYGSQVLLNDSGLVACAGTSSNGSQTAFLLSTDPDADNDGLPDSWELQYNVQPTDINAEAAGSGLTYWEKYQLGLDPTKASTMDDAYTDGWKVKHGLNPHHKLVADTAGTVLALQVFTPLR